MTISVESAARMAEAKRLIAFYEERGWNWLSAQEFTLAKWSGVYEIVTRGPIRTRIGYGRPKSRNLSTEPSK